MARKKVKDNSLVSQKLELKRTIVHFKEADPKFVYRRVNPAKKTFMEDLGWVKVTQKDIVPANDKLKWRDGSWRDRSGFILMKIPKDLWNKRQKEKGAESFMKLGLPSKYRSHQKVSVAAFRDKLAADEANAIENLGKGTGIERSVDDEINGRGGHVAGADKDEDE